MTTRVFSLAILSAVACLFAGAAGAAEKPLHERIDELIEAKAKGALAPQARDAEFVRRIYLDLAGRIPSIAEVKAFVDDKAPDKRAKLIEKLLSSDDHVRRMTQIFNVMWMERLGDHEEWQAFLRESFAANKPYDQMVREVLNPDPAQEKARGAAFWYTKRLENYGQNTIDMPGMIRDVGRHFLGIDVQCAQCHDHLFVDEYKQDYYAGIQAFVGTTFIRTDLKFPAIALKPLDKKVEFMSVFVKEPKSVGPKLPGKAEIPLPEFKKGEEFDAPPDKKTNFPGVPKFNTLKLLSEQLPTSDNRLFTRNIANRLWWMTMGRGLVWPLDLHHSGNEASHPELLDLLATEMVARKFDLRAMIREIVSSKTYQRSGQLPGDSPAEVPAASYRLALAKPLSSEQMLASIRQALGKPEPLAISLGEKSWKEWQTRFDKSLTNPPREPEVEHAPTVKGALFVMNDSQVFSWLAPAGDNLTARLDQQKDVAELAKEMYLALLAREPDEAEQKEVSEYLASHANRRQAAIGNLVWALLASNEFCANH